MRCFTQFFGEVFAFVFLETINVLKTFFGEKSVLKLFYEMIFDFKF